MYKFTHVFTKDDGTQITTEKAIGEQDVNINEVCLAFKEFLAGCGFCEKSINTYINAEY